MNIKNLSDANCILYKLYIKIFKYETLEFDIFNTI